MTWLIRNAVALLLGLAVFGCGYTILAPERRRSVSGKEAVESPRPDLSFSRIDRVEREVGNREGNPRPMTEFKITVRNEGEGVFDGSILCAYACTDDDIRHSNYPGRAIPIPAVLRRGDTTVVDLCMDQRYTRGTNMRFKIHTDAFELHPFDPAFFFGREPIRESSYENNGADYVVK